MKALLLSSMGRLRIIAFLEGLSCVALFFIAMPMKYIWADKSLIFPTGLVHGILFISYLLLLLQVSIEYKWGIKKIALAFIASIIPLGTFYADAKLFKVEA